MKELHLETYKRFEICLDRELDYIDLICIEVEADKFGIEMAVSKSQRIILMTAENLKDITTILEFLDLWPDIINVREIIDYTPSWKVNEGIND